AGGGRGVAGPHHVTLVQRGADDARSPADAGLTVVARGAGVAVVADRAVGDGRVRAGAGGGVAGPRRVALVLGGARHRRPGAQPRLTAVAAGAPVAVGARGAVRHGRVRARAGDGIAGTGPVALVERGADDRPAGAGAGLAGVAGRAGVAVVAGRDVGDLRGLRVGARRRLAPRAGRRVRGRAG